MERGSSSLNCCSTGCTCSAGRRPVMTSVKPASASLRAIPRPMPRVPPVTSATLSLSGMVCSEESVIARVGEPGDQQTKLQQMVVAPHAGFAAGDLGFRGNIVPAIGAMVDALQEQTFVLGIDRKIRFLQQLLRDAESGLRINYTGCAKEMTETK